MAPARARARRLGAASCSGAVLVRLCSLAAAAAQQQGQRREFPLLAVDVLPAGGEPWSGKEWLAGRARLAEPGAFGNGTAAEAGGEGAEAGMPACIPRLNWPPAAEAAPWQGRVRVRMRGHSSSTFPKKSYKLETLEGDDDDAGAASKKANVDFFTCGSFPGFASTTSRSNGPLDHKFALNGPYSDKSLVRNLVMLQLMNAMAEDGDGFVPRAAPVELVLNGVYAGVYVLMDLVTPARLDLEKKKEEEDGQVEGRQDDDPSFSLAVRRSMGEALPALEAGQRTSAGGAPADRLLESHRFFLKNDHLMWGSDPSNDRPHIWRCDPSAMNIWFVGGGDDSGPVVHHAQNVSTADQINVGIDVGRALGLLSETHDDKWPSKGRLRQLILEEDPCAGYPPARITEPLTPRPFAPPMPRLARLDVASWIDHLFIQEVSANVDGYMFSTYLHADRDRLGGRLTLGPGWDFNLAFGNVNYDGAGGGGDHLQFAHLGPRFPPPGYGSISHVADVFRSLLLGSPASVAVRMPKGGKADDWAEIATKLACTLPTTTADEGDVNRSITAFRCQVARRWANLRSGAWSTGGVDAILDLYVSALTTPDDLLTNSSAADRNFDRWGGVSKWVWPNPTTYRTYHAATNDLKRWVHRRLRYLDGALVPLTPLVRIVDEEGHKKSETCNGAPIVASSASKSEAHHGKGPVVCVVTQPLDPDYCVQCEHPIWAGDEPTPSSGRFAAAAAYFGVAATAILLIATILFVIRRKKEPKEEIKSPRDVAGEPHEDAEGGAGKGEDGAPSLGGSL